MAEKRTYGLKEILMGDAESDGAMGILTSLSDTLGTTYKGSASITQDDAEEKEFYCEELDIAIEKYSKKGKIVLEWAITDFTPATMIKVLGGTESLGVWKAPATAPEIFQSVQITTKKNHVIKIAKAKIDAKLDWKLGDEDLGLIRIKATVLTPDKTAEPALTITPA